MLLWFCELDDVLFALLLVDELVVGAVAELLVSMVNGDKSAAVKENGALALIALRARWPQVAAAAVTLLDARGKGVLARVSLAVSLCVSVCWLM